MSRASPPSKVTLPCSATGWTWLALLGPSPARTGQTTISILPCMYSYAGAAAPEHFPLPCTLMYESTIPVTMMAFYIPDLSACKSLVGG
jgi:hypothetical protein